MTRITFGRTGRAAIAAFLIAAGAAVSVPAVHAQSDANDNFIAFLDKEGVPYESAVEAIRMAKEFCRDATRQGYQDWVASYRFQTNSGLTQTEAESFIEGAIYTYCPKAWGLD